MSFDGQHVVIVGASAGIGEAAAKVFAEQGAAVTITGRFKERLDQAAQRIGRPALIALAAANGALETIVAPLAVELAPLRVNAVSPGDTHWWNAMPEDQRRAYFDASVGYVTGTVLECTGGSNLTAAALAS